MNKNLSFEAWKRNIKIWRDDNPLGETQKLTLILENLKKNAERAELKDWIIQEIDEDYNFNKKDENSILRLLKKMEGKFKISKWKKTKEIWDKVLKFICTELRNVPAKTTGQG